MKSEGWWTYFSKKVEYQLDFFENRKIGKSWISIENFPKFSISKISRKYFHHPSLFIISFFARDEFLNSVFCKILVYRARFVWKWPNCRNFREHSWKFFLSLHITPSLYMGRDSWGWPLDTNSENSYINITGRRWSIQFAKMNLISFSDQIARTRKDLRFEEPNSKTRRV